MRTAKPSSAYWNSSRRAASRSIRLAHQGHTTRIPKRRVGTGKRALRGFRTVSPVFTLRRELWAPAGTGRPQT